MTEKIEMIYQKLLSICGEDAVLREEPMAQHTSFRIGGPAQFFLCPGSAEDIATLVRYCREEALPYFIMGNGSNLLVADAGYRGIVIQLYRNFQNVTIEGTCIRAEAGALLSTIANLAKDEGLSGMEFASGIPGALGGAVMMNAGAYGSEMKDILRSATVLDADCEIREVSLEELALGYRTSAVKREGWIVLGATLALEKGDPEEIAKAYEKLREQRTQKQPLNYPSAGSTFKRPEGYFAGKLIMDAGLSGYSVGDAQISEKHCGFVINKGAATAADVLALIRHTQDTVEAKFGVRLEPEVRFLGEFDK